MPNSETHTQGTLPGDVKYWSYETSLVGKTFHLVVIDSTHIYYNFHEFQSRRDKALKKILDGTPVSDVMSGARKTELSGIDRVEILPWIQMVNIYSLKKIEVDTWGCEFYRGIFQELNDRLGGKVEERLATINESVVPNYYVLGSIIIVFAVGFSAVIVEKNEKPGNMAGMRGEFILRIIFEISRFIGPIGGWILMIIGVLALSGCMMYLTINRPTKELFYSMGRHS